MATSTTTSANTGAKTTSPCWCSPNSAGASKTTAAGTDHGSGGTAFVLGGQVSGGLYGEYPSLAPDMQLEGDLHYNNDFRMTYATLLERWFGIDSEPIVNGRFEQFDFLPA